MIRRIATLAAMGAALTGALAGSGVGVAGASASVTSAYSASLEQRSSASVLVARCQEDESCWRWPKMGNLDRGVYLQGRRARVVVDPCEFAFADFYALIDWHRTRPLAGDRFARRHGCDPRYYAPLASH